MVFSPLQTVWNIGNHQRCLAWCRYGVGGVFVPLKFDALESPYRCLYGQNSFRTGFVRVKLERFLGLSPCFCVPCLDWTFRLQYAYEEFTETLDKG